MKTREIACIHYKNEGNCDLGKECSFYGHCQNCSTYKKRPGAKPARTDLRRKKIERIRKKEFLRTKGE